MLSLSSVYRSIKRPLRTTFFYKNLFLNKVQSELPLTVKSHIIFRKHPMRKFCKISALMIFPSWKIVFTQFWKENFLWNPKLFLWYFSFWKMASVFAEFWALLEILICFNYVLLENFRVLIAFLVLLENLMCS